MGWRDERRVESPPSTGADRLGTGRPDLLGVVVRSRGVRFVRWAGVGR